MVQSNNDIMKRKRKDTVARVYTWATFVSTAVMVGLRMAGLIDWSWIWITAPLWVNVIIAIVLVIWANVWFYKYGRD